MRFSSPWGLSALGLALPVIVFHILKSERIREVVSSTQEWVEVARPVSANRPWQRLRWSIPLALQLLAVTLLALALGGLSRSTGETSADHVVYLIDSSASMGAQDGDPTRFDTMLDDLASQIDRIGDGAVVSLISTGSPAELRGVRLTPSDAKRVLGEMSVGEGEFDGEASGSLALSLDDPDRSVDYVLATDGGLDASDLRLMPSGTRVIQAGSRDANLAITNAVVSPQGVSTNVLVTVENFGDNTVATDVRVDVDGITEFTEAVEIDARSAVELNAEVPAGDRIDVFSDADDLLALDDHYFAAGVDQLTTTVVVIGSENLFLEAFLASQPNVDALRFDTFEGAFAELAAADLVIFDRVDVPDDVAIPWLAIAPPGGAPQVSVDGEVELPVPTLVRSEIPLLSGVDLSGLQIATAQSISAPSATTLIGAEQTPLLVSGRSAEVPFVYMGFDLESSNLGLLAEFPILGDRILTPLARSDLRSGSLNVGDPLTLDSGADAVVISPSGTETSVVPGGLTPDLDRAGFWTVESEDHDPQLIVVNIAPSESNIAPTDGLAIPGAAQGGAETDREALQSLVPLLIGLALFVLVAEWAVSRRRRGVPLRQWRWAEAARVAAAVVLLVALFAPTIGRKSNDVAVVFVLDQSDSMGSGRAEGVDVLAGILDDQPKGSVAGVVVVGERAAIDRSISDRLSWGAPRVSVGTSATDLASGLRIAGAIAPPEKARRVVLLSDGRPTVGSTDREIARLARNDVRLDVLDIEAFLGADVLVRNVSVPQNARSGDAITIEAELEATDAQTVTVELERDGTVVDSKVVDIDAGTTTVSFEQAAGQPGSIRWTVRVSGPSNGVAQNDIGRSSTRIEGRAEVLLIEGSPATSTKLSSAVAASGAAVTTRTVQAIDGLATLAAFDVVILDNVSARDLSTSQVEALDIASRELGKGLVVLGGTSAFGPGGYLGSPLETLLPVTSEVKDPKRKSSLAQVFAVDVSGSMGACHCAEGAEGGNGNSLGGGVTKSRIARSGVVRAIEVMNRDDEVGILTLDDKFVWEYDLSKVGDGKGALDATESINAADENGAGSTMLDPALSEAAAQLRESSASLRHIVMVTDGFEDSLVLNDLAKQAAGLRDEGITVSVMGTGEGASEELRPIAEAGGGRYYPGRDLKALPDLLEEETKVVARQLIEEGEFLPEISSADPIIGSLVEAPILTGYVATTAKPTAQVHLRVGEFKDPLLSSWQVGVGKVVAWTSDSGQRWASNWAVWQGNVGFWSDVIRSVLPTSAGSIEITEKDGEEKIEAVFESAVPAGQLVEATIARPGGRSETVLLQRVDDVRFSAPVTTGAAGTYGVGVSAKNGQEIASSISGVVDIGFSREYAAEGTNAELLGDWSSATGGRGVVLPTEVFDKQGLVAGETRVETQKWLLWLAALLIPLIVGLSRFRRAGGEVVIAAPKPNAMSKIGLSIRDRRAASTSGVGPDPTLPAAVQPQAGTGQPKAVSGQPTAAAGKKAGEPGQAKKITPPKKVASAPSSSAPQPPGSGGPAVDAPDAGAPDVGGLEGLLAAKRRRANKGPDEE